MTPKASPKKQISQVTLSPKITLLNPPSANFANVISPLSSGLTNLIYEFEMPDVKETNPVDALLSKPGINRKRSCSPSRTHKRRMSHHANMAKTAVGLRQLAKKMGETELAWVAKPNKVLIVCKLGDPSLVQLALDVAAFLIRLGLTVYIQEPILADYLKMDGPHTQEITNHLHISTGKLQFWDEVYCATVGSEEIDFVLSLGGDGTVLFAAWLFQTKCPPIVPFNLGSLGFLTVFDHLKMDTVIHNILKPGSTMRMNIRMRFKCTIHRADFTAADNGNSYQILNDVCVDRGPSPFLSQLELYGNSSHLTTVQADGLVIATPTGSTAYSLSAGGSVVHPDVSAILVTPICPHTLSFRPMILPDTMDVRVLVPEDSRSTAWVSFDGRHRVHLKAGDSIQIVASQDPVPTLCLVRQSDDWFNGLETCLAWNKRSRQKVLETKKWLNK
ncbi:hypothetical protein HDV02_005400 [Globomyces sp. JEL0801]|nr:hypothetical protein HDV02_005400 [Globomyces sp. JEL0801]